MDLNAGGLRIVPVSIELLTEILQGKAQRAVPVNVPADMKVIGSMTKADLLTATELAYPPGKIVLLCQSAEWPIGEDIDPSTHEIRTFEPTYRRT